MDSSISQHLAANIRHLREARGLSQHQVSRLAGIPRPTWANLESGGANPTLAVMLKVAGALQVSMAELISPPRAVCRYFPSGSLRTENRGTVVIRKLLPDPIPGMEIDRLELVPGARMGGVPHTPGTREYLTCESGEVELALAGESWVLGPGDLIAFRGDQAHSYHNPGHRDAVAYSVVALAPAGTE